MLNTKKSFGKKAAVTRKSGNSTRSVPFLIPRTKNGFGDAVSTLIMFIAVISVTTGLVIVFKNYVGATQDSFSVQNELTSNKLRSSITISNIYFNTSSNMTYVYVKNIGETKLTPQQFDLFVDDAFITNYNVYYADNLTKTMTLFNQQETLVLVKQINLTSGTHDVKVVTEFSTSATDMFNN